LGICEQIVAIRCSSQTALRYPRSCVNLRPGQFFPVNALPYHGTGKLHLQRLRKMAYKWMQVMFQIDAAQRIDEQSRIEEASSQ
jgi:hypothetical protein